MYRWRGTKYSFKDPAQLKDVRASIWCYRGRSATPKMKYDEPGGRADIPPPRCWLIGCNCSGMYHKLCTIVMDLSHLPYATHIREDGKGFYYQVLHDYLLYYEGTELKAQTAWMEGVSMLGHS